MMADIVIYIIAWLSSVTMMTIFSIFISHISGNEYREPTLLSKLIIGNTLHTQESARHLFFGFVLHFAFGGIFLALYVILYKSIASMSTIFWTVLTGLIFGCIGVLGWYLMLKISKNPPKIKFRGFSVQLIFAHVVFCLTAMLVFNLWL